jgi:hypothetical protein
MPKRAVILFGMATGLVWGAALLWLGTSPLLKLGASPLAMVYGLGIGFFLAGLPLLALIARLAARRFF